MNWIIPRKCDLNRGDTAASRPAAIMPLAYPGDYDAHVWQVTVTQDGEPVSLAGTTVRAYFFRHADGQSPMAVGSVEGNVASVSIPQEAYAYPGFVTGIFRVTGTATNATLDAITFEIGPNVTGSVIDPGEVIPSIDDLIDQIERMEDATDAANAAAIGDKDPAVNTPAALAYFDATQTYSSSNKLAPANLPVNSYTYVPREMLVYGGTGGFPEDLNVSGAYYWIIVFGRLNPSNVRGVWHYIVLKVAGNVSYRGRTTNRGTSVSWFQTYTPVDATLSASGQAADAATVGTAIYRSKAHAEHHPIGLTWYISSNADTLTPADIPINSYTLATGSKLSTGFPSGLVSSRSYWVLCIVSLSNASLRQYVIFDHNTGATCYGYTSDGGTTVEWIETGVDDTLAKQGYSADAQAVGTAVYLAKDRALNDPAGLTYFDISDVYSSDARATPADIPPNSYTQSAGSRLSGFPDGVVDSKTYWVFCLASRHVTAMSQRQYFVYGQTSGFFARGTSTDGGTTVTWMDLSNINELRVLCVGNSFTQDSVAYAPLLIQEMCPGIRLTMGLSYISGGSLSNYISAFNGDGPNHDGTVHTYGKFTPGASEWTVSARNARTFKSILTDETWDIITFTEASGHVTFDDDGNGDYSDLYSLINLVTPYIYAQNGHGARYAYLMPQAPLGLGGRLSYENMTAWVGGLMDAAPIDLLIPAGTAIENARGTSLNSLGDSPIHGLTYDANTLIPGTTPPSYYPGHLQEGLPVLTSSYVTALKILEWYGVKRYGIMGDPLRPTAEYLNGRTMPGPNGTSTGVTDANCYLAQKCAIAAIKKPLEASDIN